MGVNYGGRLGQILKAYKNVHCPICKTAQVQIISYLEGDPEWKCRHCKQRFSMPFVDPIPLKDHKDIPVEVKALMYLDDYSLLKAWRVHLGITQTELIKRMGCTSRSMMSRLESKDTDHLRESTRDKLAKALGIKSRQLSTL